MGGGLRGENPWPSRNRAPVVVARTEVRTGREDDAVDEPAQRLGVQLRVVDGAEVEARVERPVANAGERRAGENLVQLDVDQRVTLDRATQEVTETKRC